MGEWAMRICHVSPHLPPDQAANALLPAQLGQWMRERGDEIVYVAHEAAQIKTSDGSSDLAGPVRWIPRRAPSRGLTRALKLDSMRVARCVTAALSTIAADAHMLHLHSNGLIVEVAAAWARRRRIPYVLTLYGTEIWHYAPRRPVDPFTRAYRGAAQVTLYSQGLLERAKALGLDRPGLSVIYPPVDEAFVPRDEETRREWRLALGIREPLFILNVKRLHELAGQRFLIDAFAHLARQSEVRLVICGTGHLRDALEQHVRTRGVADRVTLAGLVPHDRIARYMAAADVFALPSLLEALPTVAVEALASGTPVISADHPGGIELQAIFGEDVTVVPREQPEPLERALGEFLKRPHRTLTMTARHIEERFRPLAIVAAFDEVYRKAIGPR